MVYSINATSTNDDTHYNGRVLIKGHEPKNVLELYEKVPIEQHTTYNNALKGVWNETPLSITFFCSKNIELLQNGIRKGVYDMSKGQYVIGNQDEDVLKMIMRSIYLQFAKHSPTIPVREQVAYLNSLVLDYAVRQVYGEAQGYIKYLYDVSTLAMPMERPVMTKEYKPNEMRYGF